MDAVDALEQRLDRRKIVGLGSCLTCAGRIEVADLLFIGGARGAGGLGFLECLPQYQAVPLGQLAVRTPAHLIGRNRVRRVQLATGVLVEVGAGIDGVIHLHHIDMLQLGQRLALPR